MEGEEAGVDGGLAEAVLCKSVGEEVEPFPPVLTKTIEAAAELDNERVPVSVMLRKARGHTHVEIFVEWSLEVCLTDVCGSEIIVSSRSESKN